MNLQVVSRGNIPNPSRQPRKATKAPQDDLERGSAAAAPQVAAAPSERSERSARRAEFRV